MLKLNLNDPHFLPHTGCDVELLLEVKEALTIIGENGLGKTSLVHHIYSRHQDIMAIIEQKSMDQFYNRSLRTIKDIFLVSAGNKTDREFFEHCWTSFGLNKKEDRMLDSLSGGEGQALKICLGLASDAKVYVLDEPSQYLDESMKKVLSNLLKELLTREKSLLMVEHDLNWQEFPMKIAELKKVNRNLIVGKEWNT
jgi:ABC-type Mn2+/Zn2+ transport system ATPase subunit